MAKARRIKVKYFEQDVLSSDDPDDTTLESVVSEWLAAAGEITLVQHAVIFDGTIYITSIVYTDA